MQILSLHENWPNPDNPAIWIHAAEQIKEVAKNCGVTVIVSPLQSVSLFHYLNQSNGDIPRFIKDNNLQIYRPKYFMSPKSGHQLNDYLKALSVIYTIYKEKISFQLIHAHYVYKTGYIGALVARYFRKPLILTAYGTDVWQLVHDEELPIRIRNCSISALNTADHITAVSRDLVKMLGQLGYGNKATFISSGIVSSSFPLQDKHECKKHLGLPVNQKFLLYVGYLAEEKGSDLLPYILKYVLQNGQDVKLIIVCRGSLSQRTLLEKEMVNLGLGKKVKFVEKLSTDEVAKYMGAAELLLMPSRQEGRPVAAREALSCGIPIVATRVGGLPEIINDDNLGILVEPDNPKALADAVNQALSQKWDAELLNRSADQFCWENIIPDILNIYKRVLRLTPGTKI